MEISEHKEYSMDGVLCLTVDTTDSTKSVQDHVTDAFDQISPYSISLLETDPSITMEDDGLNQEACWRNFTHDHSLSFYPELVLGPNDDEATFICPLYQETPSGSVYGCSQCGLYLHKSCAELPHTIMFGEQCFDLRPTSKEEIIKSRECLVCYGSSGVLYSYIGPLFNEHEGYIHPKCALLPHKLKHSCHEHCLERKIFHTVFTCGACGTYGNVAGYYCESCRVRFHMTCTLCLEASVIHKCHWHPLVLCTIPRDETNEYYCEICATERHPDLWVYYCKLCEYEAHVSHVNLRIKQCNPDVLLSENRSEGKLSHLWRYAKDLPDLRNPILTEISGSQLVWESVDSEVEADMDSK